MIAGHRPYPAMKDSGADWLGEVPEHWKVLPGRACIYEKQEPNTGMVEDTVLSLSYGRIVVKPPEKLRGLVPESFETYQVVDPGDIICRPTDLQNDRTSLRFGIAGARGIITSAYMCLRTNGLLNSGFGYLLFHAYDLKKIFYGLGSGLRQNLSWEDFKYLPCATPPLSEQADIVRYLDHLDRRVRRLVRAKRKLIVLLTEQKQAIIHRAVTRGLDPDVPLRPSGLPWCPQIPDHWDLKPNRAFVRQRKVLVGERHTEYTLLSLTKKGVIVRDLSENKGKFSSDLGTSQEVREGDLVMCLFDVPETPRTVGLSRHSGMITGAYTVFEPRHKDVVEWLETFYIAMDDRKLLSPLYSGLRNTIPKPRFLRAKTPIPPGPERADILSRIAEMTADIEAAASRAQHEIEFLNEYRTRLIADVVTGKLDVSEAVAALPEVDPLDADDTADEALTASDEAEADELEAEVEEAGA